MPWRGFCWEKCCVSGCNVTICVNNCGSAVSGASVSISGVGSCTTSGTGCCSINIGTAGSYTITVTKFGFTTIVKTLMLSCGETVILDFHAITICVTSWCGASFGAGATVTVLNGMTTVATGTTDSSGCVDLSFSGGSGLTVQISFGGWPTVTVTGQTLTCGTSNGYSILTFAGATATLTDANGTHAVCLGTIPNSQVCYLGPATPGCNGTSTTTAILYTILCSGSNVIITRSWGTGSTGGGCYVSPVPGQPSNCDDTIHGPVAGCASGFFCPENNTCYSNGTFTQNPQDPTGSVTGSLSFQGLCGTGTSMPDPVGGTIALSFTL